MCGRFGRFRSLHDLKKTFPIDKTTCEVTENYNVSPSQEVLAIVKHEKENGLEKRHWRLVPFWAKDKGLGLGIKD